MAKRGRIAAIALACVAGVAQATDYYVSPTGSDSTNSGTSVDDPFETIDMAVITARTAGDVIHVLPGTYETTLGLYDSDSNAKWGPNLCVKMIGEGATRDAVVIKSHGSHRTLRTAAGAWIENVTLEGCTDISKADKGGTVEMSGGTITNCVITAGTAYGSDRQAGGNLYMNNDAALVVDCVISNGQGKNHGGNICLIKGTLRNCTITGGVTTSDGDQKFGANIYMTGGRVDGCTISNGDGYEGGEIYQTGGMVTDSTILANGVTRGSGGGIYMTNGTVANCLIDAEGGTMSWHGGCLYMKNGTVTNTVCRNGVCMNGDTREGGNVYMENGTFVDVTLENGRSGKQGGNLRMANGTITRLTCRNGSSNLGGNIQTSGGTIKGLVCENGTATTDGGNIRAANVTITDAIISGGKIVTDDDKKGANIYMDGSTKLIRSRITGGVTFKADGETAGYNGGSVCSYSGDAVIDNCLIEGSSCGGILLGTTGHLYNTTIVNNGEYGVWSWTPSQVFQNCVIYGNLRDGTVRDWAGDAASSFVNCATSTAGQIVDSTIGLTNDDFADYENGDYRPAGESSQLVDRGAADEREGASATDLDGRKRMSEDIDIGCYEFQHSNMTVMMEVPELSVGYAPATASFSVSSENAPGDVTYVVAFGDGELLETSDTTFTHVYTSSGTFTVTVRAKSLDEESKTATRTITLVDKVQRVGADAHATIQDAIAASVSGCEVVVSAGTYEVVSPIEVSKAVSVIGEGAVIVRNTRTATADGADCRVMKVSNGALVAGFTLEGGEVYNGVGGCVTVSGATVSNCVIRGGVARRGETGNPGGAGVALYANSVLTHCQVTGNTLYGPATGSGDWGGAVYVVNSQKPVRILNSLIAGNRMVCAEGADPRTGAAGLVFGGGNENSLVENCTIAGNTVDGALSSDSAGAYCTSWSVTFRNNVIAGNYETAKGESGQYTSAHISVDHCPVRSTMTDDVEPLNGYCFVATRDEMFKNFAGGDYRPKTQGALWNKGTETTSGETTDLLGNPRVKFDVIDLGCYEMQQKLGFTVSIR